MNKLLLCIILLLPMTVFAQGKLQLRYAMEGTADVNTERIHAQRQAVLQNKFTDVPKHAIDRIQVGIYTPDNKLVESQEAWLLNDNSVVSITAEPLLQFEASQGQYIVVVTQNSHLPLISKQVTLDGSLLDLTRAENLQEGCFLKTNGHAVAIAGNLSNPDFERVTAINAMDYFWLKYYQMNPEGQVIGDNGYPKGDVNLDTKVDDLDAQIVERNANAIRWTSFRPNH